MKKLIEKKNSLIDEMEGILEKAKAETRAFTDAEDERVEAIKKEIRGLEKVIADEEAKRQFDKTIVEKGDKVETRSLEVQNKEIRQAIENEKELDITNFEIEERTAIGTPNVGSNGASVGNIAKTTFANAILKKATETSDLYRYVRKENFGSALHQIPVQKTKITKFANVKELAAYTEKNIDFEPIQLAAHKFGNISIISEECLADTGYNIMSELLEQYGEGAGLTIDELLVKGDPATTVQGLNSFVNGTGDMQSGAIKQSVKKAGLADIGLKEILAMYNGLPNKYRKNATWVIGTELAARLAIATDANGRPLLSNSFNETPFGSHALLLGRPVVISDYITNITGAEAHTPLAFFGDLSKALILGLRQNFTIKSSSEYKFVQDGIAVKGTMRLDAKRGLGEALTALVVVA